MQPSRRSDLWYRGGGSRGDSHALQAKKNAALSVALGGLPEQMRVEVDADIGVSASTVGQLRNMTVWPDNLVITTPQEVYAESVVRVSKISHATRISPKP
jgi:hypothetical protein